MFGPGVPSSASFKKKVWEFDKHLLVQYIA